MHPKATASSFRLRCIRTRSLEQRTYLVPSGSFHWRRCLWEREQRPNVRETRSIRRRGWIWDRKKEDVNVEEIRVASVKRKDEFGVRCDHRITAPSPLQAWATATKISSPPPPSNSQQHSTAPVSPSPAHKGKDATLLLLSYESEVSTLIFCRDHLFVVAISSAWSSFLFSFLCKQKVFSGSEGGQDGKDTLKSKTGISLDERVRKDNQPASSALPTPPLTPAPTGQSPQPSRYSPLSPSLFFTSIVSSQTHHHHHHLHSRSPQYQASTLAPPSIALGLCPGKNLNKPWRDPKTSEPAPDRRQDLPKCKKRYHQKQSAPTRI